VEAGVRSGVRSSSWLTLWEKGAQGLLGDNVNGQVVCNGGVGGFNSSVLNWQQLLTTLTENGQLIWETGEMEAGGGHHDQNDYECADGGKLKCIEYDGCMSVERWGQCPSQWKCGDAPQRDYKATCDTSNYNIHPPNPCEEGGG
jgi:hypothetical protein